MDEHDVLEMAIETYGNDKQTDMMIEEMSELTKALLKYRRNPHDDELTNIREELADVSIMLEQMCLIYGLFDDWIEVKLNRLADRLGMNVKDDRVQSS